MLVLIQTLVVGSVIIALGYASALCVVTVLAAVRAGGRREDAPESAAALAASRLTIPVSIIVPAGAALEINRTICDLLELNYPEFEVIVVVDRPAAAVDAIEREWQLESVEFFYRRTLDTGPVRRIFRSQRDPRLTIVEKEAGHASDALNVGVNIGRYRFVAVVPLDAAFDRDSLLRAMGPALDDPRSVVGVFSPLERRSANDGLASEADFLRLRTIRASMMARLFHSGLSRQMEGHGVRLWRRDALLAVGGFSLGAVRPDIDMAFRVIRDAECRVVCSLEPFGSTPANGQTSLVSDARDRQRAALDVLRGLGRGSWTGAARQGIGAFLEAELLTPIVQCWILVGSLLGVALGAVSWPAAVASLILLSFGSALISASAVLLAGSNQRNTEGRDAKRLLLASPLEFVLFRPRLAMARLSAVISSRQSA